MTSLTHDIEHDVDIAPSRTERCKAMRLYKHRLVYSLPQLFHGHIESFRMAYLHCHLDFLAEAYQFVSFRDCRRNRFLQKNVLFVFQEERGNLVMSACWHGDAHGIDMRRQRRIVAERFRVEFRCDFPDAFRIDVRDSR